MSGLCDEVEKFGKGVGNASRYRIIEALFGGGLTVGEIVKKTKLSQSLVSQHLRILREMELVEDERHGQIVRYTLNSKYVIDLLKRLTEEIKPSKR